MSTESTIYNELQLRSEVSSLVSDRVFPLRLPEASGLPAITYQVTRLPVYSQSGISYYTVTLRLNCWSHDYDESISVADAVKLVLNGTTILPSCNLSRQLPDQDPDSGLIRQIVEFAVEEAA